MKKRIESIILCVMICIIFSACGGSNSKATIEISEGEEVEMTAKELMDAYDGNEASFKEKYGGNTITFTGTISSIKTNADAYFMSDGPKSGWNEIWFEEGWCLLIYPKDKTYDLASYEPGDKVTVTSAIYVPSTEEMAKENGDSRAVFILGECTYEDGAVTIHYKRDVETKIEAVE
jgi:hypothetical protein